MSTLGDVEVDPIVVLYAFRYGLNRATGAHDDAIALVRAHWPHLRRWADTIERDLRDAARLPHPLLTRTEIAATVDLIDWVAKEAGRG